MLLFGNFFTVIISRIIFFFQELGVKLRELNGRSIIQYVLYLQIKFKMLCFHLHITNMSDFIKKKSLRWSWRPTISKQPGQVIHLSAKQVPTQCGGKRLVSNLTQILTHKLISNSIGLSKWLHLQPENTSELHKKKPLHSKPKTHHHRLQHGQFQVNIYTEQILLSVCSC